MITTILLLLLRLWAARRAPRPVAPALDVPPVTVTVIWQGLRHWVRECPGPPERPGTPTIPAVDRRHWDVIVAPDDWSGTPAEV